MSFLNYTSTRNPSINISAAEAIIKGISAEGGLFVPTEIPKLKKSDFLALSEKSYNSRAYDVLKLFLDFSETELQNCVTNAYGKNFAASDIVEIVKLGSGAYMLELWHGPTAAFKDMALQILPHMLTTSLKKFGVDGKTLILVATSGDTGKAALDGFKDINGINIAVFYPEDGVSDMQKLQMATQEGANVHVFAVKGNFDDCQNGVKAVFTNSEIIAKAAENNIFFSSANSINWGRLCPQIVYYISAYSDMLGQGQIAKDEEINICVPTGNFGNILAAYYAKEMGVPVKKLICASNTNNILTDFINTGIYDRNRKFYTTVSPSMDILISSNLERLLYHLSPESINQWFTDLREKGRFEVDETVKNTLHNWFYAGWCNEDDTKRTIKEVFDTYDYLIDPHTAVGYKVSEDYRRKTGDKSATIIASTANPYKFGTAVYEALTGNDNPDTPMNEFALITELERISANACPETLTAIMNKPIRFKEVFDKSEIPQAVLKIL
ncbi:MAG: threonine synthase [Oscillospiraceae bacterium]|nr:threonine synthase [Oscillospiraceae bacterium]